MVEVMSKDHWVRLIGLLKLVKGILLFASGIGLLKLLHKDVRDFVLQWINTLHFDPDNRHIQSLLIKASFVNERQLKELSVGSFFYAALLITEGTGLLLVRRWAEYFSVVVTSSFIPLEIWELFRHFSAAKVLVIVVNVAIVVYLVIRLRSELRSAAEN
jgi:uncharacterized membrane protein (DUF2068 family)